MSRHAKPLQQEVFEHPIFRYTFAVVMIFWAIILACFIIAFLPISIFLVELPGGRLTIEEEGYQMLSVS